MTITQKIVPNIWCNRNAEQAANFYEEAFTAANLKASSKVEGRYPEEGLLDFQKEFAGQPVTITVTIEGTDLTLINAGDEFRPNPGLSFMLNFDPLMFDGSEDKARESLEALWAKLKENGKELMPLGEYPFSKYYGWVEDEFGVNWQLILTNPEGDPRPFIVPSIMFDGDAQDRAAEAADFYVSQFEDAEVGNKHQYGETTGKASAEALAFGEFRIGDQWFVVMDNGSGQDHGIDGVSLLVSCKDQQEIDRLWDAMSAVPEMEQCGWLKDKFGVAWQIVPENMEELMQRPNAYEHMMQMKKLVIADF